VGPGAKMSDRYIASDHALVDAIRAVLGLEPIYGQEKETPLWDAHPFSDGCRRSQKRSSTSAQGATS